MNKNAIRLLGIVLTVVVIGGILFWQYGQPNEGVGPAPAQEKAPMQSVVVVNAIVVQPTTLQETISATGTLLPDESVALTVESSGIVQSIHFQEGKAVVAGQLLLTLDNADLQAQLGKVQHEITLATDKEYRQEALLARGAISQEEYDRTLTTLRTLEADSALLAIQIEKTYLRAPFDGVIGLRQVSVGAYLTPSSVVADLVRLDPIKVEFAIPEKYANRIGPGDEVEFEVESAGGRHRAIVYAKSPQIEATTRTIRLRATAPNPEQLFTVGSFVSLDIALAQYENTIQVPAEAIVPELGSQKVFLVKGGKAAVVEVSTGLRTAKFIQVIDGIAPGDTVITDGVLQVRPGSLVSINNLEMSPSL